MVKLDQVEKVRARLRDNGFAAWREITPKHNRMIDAMLSAPLHVLVSMRVKTEWIVDKDERTGKSKPRKVGLQPVMRDGIEYEFDVCGETRNPTALEASRARGTLHYERSKLPSPRRLRLHPRIGQGLREASRAAT